MTNEQAQREAKRRWGKKSAVRNAGHFSSPEKRETATLAVREARREIEEAEKEIRERLAACDWYQELQSRKRAAREVIEKNQSAMHFHRFDVGYLGGMSGFSYFHVLGSGDTWEQAFEAADKKGKNYVL